MKGVTSAAGRGCCQIQLHLAPHSMMVTVTLIICLLASSAVAAPLKEILEIAPVNRVTSINLTVTTTRVSIPLYRCAACTVAGDPWQNAHDIDEPNEVLEYVSRVYEFDGVMMIPGPVIHVAPGGRLKLRLFNALGPQDYPETSDHLYSFHGVNSTNVHFHGVHGDPEVDDVFKVAPPNATLTYNLKIPIAHLPGLHWYHTHSHGSSYLLLMGGLFGPMIVDDATMLGTAPHSSPLSDLRTYVLVIHLYRLARGPPQTCDGTVMSDVDSLIRSNMSSRPMIRRQGKSGEQVVLPPDLYVVNGQHRPTVKLISGEQTLLRLLFAAGSCHVNISFPLECTVHVAAVDGIPLKRTRALPDRWLYFTTATRYDVVVACVGPKVWSPGRRDPLTAESGTKTNGSTALPVVIHGQERSAYNWALLLLEVADPDHRPPASGTRKGLTFPLQLPRYHADYLIVDARPKKVHREISFSHLGVPSVQPYYWIGQGTNCSSLTPSATCGYNHFEGQLGTVNRSAYNGFAIPLGAVVEARVYGDPADDVPHPLHMHVNHYQVVGFTARPGGRHEGHTLKDYGVHTGEFRDTIPILDGVTVIRWQAASYPGEVVYHCHALQHEDRGMMRSYLVYRDVPAPLMGSKTSSNPFSKVNGGAHLEKDVPRGRFLVFAMVFFTAAFLAVLVRAVRRHEGGLLTILQWIRNRRVPEGQALDGNELENLPLVTRHDINAA